METRIGLVHYLERISDRVPMHPQATAALRQAASVIRGVTDEEFSAISAEAAQSGSGEGMGMCDVCAGDSPVIRHEVQDDCFVEFYVDTDGKADIYVDGYDVPTFKINYCPVCGRKLATQSGSGEGE